jgi:hypothetical protein
MGPVERLEMNDAAIHIGISHHRTSLRRLSDNRISPMTMLSSQEQVEPSSMFLSIDYLLMMKTND